MNLLHRVHRTDSLEWLRGRDSVELSDLRDRALLASVETESETIDRLDVTLFHSPGGQWSRHLWSRLELDAVVAQTLVEDCGGRSVAVGRDFETEAVALAGEYHNHRPLGELRAGSGQIGAGAAATLPPGLPSAIIPLADAMHRVWNGRDPDQLSPLWAENVAWSGPDGANGDRAQFGDWIAGLLSRCHDSVLLFDDAVVSGDRAALLWRFHGDHAARSRADTGGRIRLIGSTLVRFADGMIVEDQTLIDTLALAVQLRAPTLEY